MTNEEHINKIINEDICAVGKALNGINRIQFSEHITNCQDCQKNIYRRYLRRKMEYHEIQIKLKTLK